jgi:hypothetical protein
MEIPTASTGEANSRRPEFNADAGSEALPLPGESPSEYVLSPPERHMKYGMLEPDFPPESPPFDARFVPVCNITSLEL